MASPSLTRTEVRKISRELKAQGLKLPKVGWCKIFKTPVADKHGRLRSELCRDPRGYWFVGDKGYAR